MSDLTAIFLTLGTFIAAFVAANYAMKIVNDRMDEVITGIVKGVAVSVKHRWIMLYNQALPYLTSLAAFSLLAAIGFLRIAHDIDGQEASLLMYAIAALCGWAFFMFLILGSITMLHCVSVLRQAEAG